MEVYFKNYELAYLLFDYDVDLEGMLLNSHTGLMNTDVTAPVRSTDLHRSRDPGTGASSSYHDVQFKAKIDVEAGSELYLEYGNSWFVDRVETFGMVPLSHDFIEADKLLSNFSYIFDESRDMPSGLNKELVSDALSILANITSSRPRLASIIPRDVASFQAAMERGTAELTLPNRIRSQDWLEKNGRCLDNIRPEKSTIRQAGRGAFATRSIKKSEIITSMPLAHLRRRHVDLYDGDNTSNTEGRFWLEGKQQLINYCFGHPDSSLLLFPYSPVVNYVNHNLTGYNAELVWSDLPTHRKDWFNRNPDEIEAEGHAGLVLEMVASRDIHAGEEIFLSYGDSWEAAWNAHLEQWSPSEYDLLYTSSIEMNQQLDWIRTVAELSIEPNQRLLADHVKTVCYVGSHIGLILSTLSDQTSVQTIKWKGKDNLFDTNDYAYSCVILERHDSQLMSDHVYDRKDSIKPIEVTYKVALKTRDDRVVMVEDVPRKAIQFFDAPYTTDDAMRTAFRHEIQLPDGMIPPAWRDLKPQTMHNTK